MSETAFLFWLQPPFAGAYNTTSLCLELQPRGILVKEYHEGKMLVHKACWTEFSLIAYHGSYMYKSPCHLRKTLAFNSEVI